MGATLETHLLLISCIAATVFRLFVVSSLVFTFVLNLDYMLHAAPWKSFNYIGVVIDFSILIHQPKLGRNCIAISTEAASVYLF